MRREKLLYVGGDRHYERFSPTAKSEDLIAVEDTHSMNGEIERQFPRRIIGSYLC